LRHNNTLHTHTPSNLTQPSPAPIKLIVAEARSSPQLASPQLAPAYQHYSVKLAPMYGPVNKLTRCSPNFDGLSADRPLGSASDASASLPSVAAAPGRCSSQRVAVLGGREGDSSWKSRLTIDHPPFSAGIHPPTENPHSALHFEARSWASTSLCQSRYSSQLISLCCARRRSMAAISACESLPVKST